MLPDPAAARYAGHPDPIAPFADVPLDSGAALSTARLLRMAVEMAVAEFGVDDWRASVAHDLIACTAEMVALLPKGDVQAAQEMLGAARAAIGTATYAVGKLRDDVRMEMK